MPRRIAPTVPEIIFPAGGDEVSNLRPQMEIRWRESTDVYYTEHVEGNAAGYQDNKAPDFFEKLDPGVVTGLYYEPWSYGRISRLRFRFRHSLGINDIYAELYRAHTDGYIQVGPDTKPRVVLDELVHSDYLDRDGYLDVPYEKAQVLSKFALKLTNVSNGQCTMHFSISYTTQDGFSVERSDYQRNKIPSGELRQNEEGKYYYTASTYPFQGNFYPTVSIEYSAGHQDDITYEIELSLDNGTSWTRVANRMSYADLYSYDFSREIEEVGQQGTYQARMRIRAVDTNDEYYVQYAYPPKKRLANYSEWAISPTFTIIKHTNPDKPTNLRVSETNIIDKNIANRLTWKHNHKNINNRQGKALIKWRKQGETVWNEITVDSMNQFYDIPAGTFPIGIIEATVQTWSYVLMESPVSSVYLFEAKDTPAAPNVAAPSETVEETSPYVVFEHSYIQTHYQIQVLDMSNNVLWDTGQVAGNTVSHKIGLYLGNLTIYKAQVRIKNSEGLWTHWGFSIFQTDYKYPPPAVVSAVAMDGFIRVTYENGTPSGQQPFTDRNEVYKQVDAEWELIADGYTHDFNDYSAPNDVDVRYFVRSYAANGAYTDSEIVSVKVKLQGVVLYLVNDPEGTRYNFKRVITRQSRKRKESVTREFKGREYPTKEIGTMKRKTIDFSLIMDEEDKRAFDKIYESDTICCYLDGKGRLAYVLFDDYPLVDRPGGLYKADFSLEKLSYIEKL